jgi:uncharacterized BrkB/YihY/UPF0761 family membrane protein
MGDSLSLKIDLIPLAAAIVLISVSTTLAMALTRRLNRQPEDADSLPVTLRLTIVIAVGLIGVALLFQGLFE